jgi:hypothetical protein
MYQFNGGTARNITWVSPHFDGSLGSGGRNVFNIVAPAGSSVKVGALSFLGGVVAGLNGGYFTYTATDPTGSADPGFYSFYVMGTDIPTVTLKGFHTLISVPQNQSVFNTYSLAPSQIANNSVYNLPPPFKMFRDGTEYQSPGPAMQPLGWSRYKITYNTGTTNFTVTPQSSGATVGSVAAASALTQFVQLFTGPGTGTAGVQGFDVRGVYIRSVTACTGPTTLKVTGFGSQGSPTLFASTTTPAGYVLNYDLEAAVGATNLYNPPYLNATLGTDTAQNIGIMLTSTGSNINTISNNCAWNVDVLWAPLP